MFLFTQRKALHNWRCYNSHCTEVWVGQGEAVDNTAQQQFGARIEKKKKIQQRSKSK